MHTNIYKNLAFTYFCQRLMKGIPCLHGLSNLSATWSGCCSYRARAAAATPRVTHYGNHLLAVLWIFRTQYNANERVVIMHSYCCNFFIGCKCLYILILFFMVSDVRGEQGLPGVPGAIGPVGPRGPNGEKGDKVQCSWQG